MNYIYTYERSVDRPLNVPDLFGSDCYSFVLLQQAMALSLHNRMCAFLIQPSHDSTWVFESLVLRALPLLHFLKVAKEERHRYTKKWIIAHLQQVVGISQPEDFTPFNGSKIKTGEALIQYRIKEWKTQLHVGASSALVLVTIVVDETLNQLRSQILLDIRPLELSRC